MKERGLIREGGNSRVPGEGQQAKLGEASPCNIIKVHYTHVRKYCKESYDYVQLGCARNK